MTAAAGSATVGPRALGSFVAALVDELARAGIRHVCACPGSRSTPLVLAAARHPAVRLWMHLDERSAAFFGLGLAKARREPVALLCTSGTAAANFLPAVVEAFYARVPLVVLTADRPHELRDRGAPQTIDQLRLYGTHVKWFADLPEPDDQPILLRYVRSVASRAVAAARARPPGPVHLNCPFREPLAPVWPTDPPTGLPSGGFTAAEAPRAPDPAAVEALARDLTAAPRGLIVCGPLDTPAFAPAAVELAAALGYPILADPLSGVRCGPHDRSLVLDCYDALLRQPALAERLAPEVVIRFGALPTAKSVALFLQAHPCRQIVVDSGGGWNDPLLTATDVLHADEAALCRALARAVRARGGEPGSEWAQTWCAADRRARRALDTCLAGITEPFEGKVFSELAALLPDRAVLYAGNSMPVRDLDSFFPGSARQIRFLANRGANGIDGVVSSALGASAGTTEPVVLVIGDLSFYHDLNGLLAARLHGLRATIILLNNDGGGIFSFLPPAGDPSDFERLFGTPHGLDFRPAVEMYGGRHVRFTSWEAFRESVRTALAGPGLTVIEVPTDRARNVALHRAAWQAAAAALDARAAQTG